MDKKTAKYLIIELRDIHEKSFQEISDILLKEYGIRMSRQAVHGMYKRAVENSFIYHNKELVLATNDIVNYFALGCSIQSIKSLLIDNGYKISCTEINDIIDNHSNFLTQIKNDQLNIVKSSIISGLDYSVIVKKLSYKGIEPTESVVKNLLKSASTILIDDRAADILAKVYTIKEDKNMIKDIISSYKMNVSFCKISKYFN